VKAAAVRDREVMTKILITGANRGLATNPPAA